MNISLKEIKDSEAYINVTFEPEHYGTDFKKTIKNYKRTLALPGFRPGTVPESIIIKKYGRQLLFEECATKIFKAIPKFLSENNLKIFKNPRILETNVFTANNLGNTQLNFDVIQGLWPQIDLNLEDLGEIQDFEIEISNEDLEAFLFDQALIHGKKIAIQTVDDPNQIYKIEFTVKLPNLHNIPDEKNLPVLFNLIQNPDKRPVFLKSGMTVGETFTFKLPDLSADLDFNFFKDRYNYEKEELLEFLSKEQPYQIQKLEVIQPQELNINFYYYLLPEAPANATLEELREILKIKLQNEYNRQAVHQFNQRVIDRLFENHSFDIPIETLKALALEEAEKHKFSSENERINFFYHFIQGYRLYFIHSKIEEYYSNDIAVSEDEVEASIKDSLKNYILNSNEADNHEDEPNQEPEFNTEDADFDDYQHEHQVDEAKFDTNNLMVEMMYNNIINSKDAHDIITQTKADLTRKKIQNLIHSKIKIKREPISLTDFRKIKL